MGKSCEQCWCVIFFEFKEEISIQNLVAGSIVVGFVEELFYRGFLFGQLFKYTRLGFISSVILGAALFASGHLYQSQDTIELIGIFESWNGRVCLDVFKM